MVAVVLRESAARALDSTIFSDAAATSGSLAGLLFDAVEIATTGDLKQDLAALSLAVAGGGGPPVFIASPGRAAAIAVLEPMLRPDVFPSAAVADD